MASGGGTLICGESLNSEIAMWLRSATLVLASACWKAAWTSARPCGSPRRSMRSTHSCANPTCRIPLAMERGPAMSPPADQRHYSRAGRRPRRRGLHASWAGTACQYWRAMPRSTGLRARLRGDRLDWAIKRPCSLVSSSGAALPGARAALERGARRSRGGCSPPGRWTRVRSRRAHRSTGIDSRGAAYQKGVLAWEGWTGPGSRRSSGCDVSCSRPTRGSASSGTRGCSR